MYMYTGIIYVDNKLLIEYSPYKGLYSVCIILQNKPPYRPNNIMHCKPFCRFGGRAETRKTGTSCVLSLLHILSVQHNRWTVVQSLLFWSPLFHRFYAIDNLMLLSKQ